MSKPSAPSQPQQCKCGEKATLYTIVYCGNNIIVMKFLPQRCGIGMDSWILPIDLDSLGGRGIRQPLLFINSYDWQWKRNIQRMMRLATPTSQCKIITIKYAIRDLCASLHSVLFDDHFPIKLGNDHFHT